MIQNIAFAIATLPPVAFASTANLALSGLSAVDGYTPTAGEICLVKDQTNAYNNGFYSAAAGSWTRVKFDSGTNAWVALAGGDTTYASLNIDNGVVYVNNGTANKNIQYQCAITNKNLAFGSTSSAVRFTSRRVSSNRDVFNGYVSVNTGSNTQGNGTQGFPYVTMTQDLSGASFPHVTNLAVSGSGLTESLTLTSGQSNITFQTYDTTSIGGKLSIVGTQTHATGNTRVTWKGMILNGGANPPLVYSSGNLYRHNIENVTLQTTGTSLMTIGADAQNWINLRNLDFNITAATLPLPLFTNAFTINIYNQDVRLPISGIGNVATTINIFSSSEAVRVYSTFAGTVNWLGKSFDYPVNGVITSQAQLATLMAYTTDTSQDGYWLLSGFTNPSITCTGASGTGSLVTLTFAAQAAAPFAVGSTITVAGFSPAGYNGTFTVTACTTTSVSYANTTSTTPTASGTVTQKSFTGGDIIGKQTAAGIATETWYGRTYAQAPASVKTIAGLVYLRGPGGVWSLPASGLTTTLTAAITSSSTSLPVVSTLGFPATGTVVIDGEVIFYSTKTTTSFGGLTRGFASSVAAAHNIYSVVAASPLNSALQSQLTVALTSSSTTATVTSTVGFPSSGAIQIESEAIGYTGKTATTFTGLIRGYNNSTAAAHIVGVPVMLNDEGLSQDKVSWDFAYNDWIAATVTMGGLYPSSNYTAGGSFSISVGVGADGFNEATVTSVGSVTAGNCIVGANRVIPDELKTNTRLPTLKALFKVGGTNLSLTGSTTDSLGFGLMCYDSSNSFIGFYTCTKSAFVLPNIPMYSDSSLDTVQLPSNIYSAAPIIYCANSITGAVSFGIKRVSIQKEMFSTLPSIVNQQIDQVTSCGMNGILIRSNGIVYSAAGNGSVWASLMGRGSDAYNYPVSYGLENLSPVALPSTETSIAIDCGKGNGVSYVLCANGNLYTWGNNVQGECGVGNTNVIYRPTLATTNVARVFWNNSMSTYTPDKTRLLVQKYDGYIYGAGHNTFGGLGLGDTSNRTSFTQLTWMGQNPLSVWVVGCEVGLTFVQKPDKTIWVCGYNNYGAAGTGSTTSAISTPVNVSTAWDGGNSNMIIKDIVAGMGQYDSGYYPQSTVLMLLDDGTNTLLRASGSADWSELGDGTTTQKNSPITPNVGSGRIRQIGWSGSVVGSVFALKENGDLYGWGYNGYGTIGDGTTSQRSSPVLVNTNVLEIMLPWHSCANIGHYTQSFIRKSDGYYACGYNSGGGYPGVGSVGSSSVNSWTKMTFPANTRIKLMGLHYPNPAGGVLVAVDTNNNLFGWGYNVYQGLSTVSGGYVDTPMIFKFGTPQYDKTNIALSSNSPVGEIYADYRQYPVSLVQNQPINFSTKVTDTKGYVTTGSNWKFTNLANITQTFIVTLSGFQLGSGSTNFRLYVNGSLFDSAYWVTSGSGSPGSACFMVRLNPSDYFDIRPDTAGASAVNTARIQISVIANNQVIQTDPTYLSKVKWGTPQSTTSGSDTKLTPNVIDTDSGSIWSSVNNRFNIPANGTYELKVYMIGGSLTGGWWRVKWRKNGLLSTDESFASALPASGYWPDAQGSVIIPNLKSGDYVELYTAGSGATISTGFISLLRVGDL
jgi:alpha-tubulin suppressor-like RCC1 family protein